MDQLKAELENENDNKLLAMTLDQAECEWQFGDEHMLEQIDLGMVMEQSKMTNRSLETPPEQMTSVYISNSGASQYTNEDYEHPAGLMYDSETDDMVHTTQRESEQSILPEPIDEESDSVDIDIFLAQLNEEYIL